MGSDYTKYSVSFLIPTVEYIENLNKRQLVITVVQYLLENNLSDISQLNAANLNPTHNRKLIATQSEYDLFSKDKKARYTEVNSTLGLIYVSNQWRKSTIDGFIDYMDNKFPDYFEIIEMPANDDDENHGNGTDSKGECSKIPLNQIFYGPPGTGKTYFTPIEAVKIINCGLLACNTREERFNRICDIVRSIRGLETKGNSLYRNERAIMWMFGYLLDTPFDQK
jgi:AAA+ superfamily predicted ATPase